jgi:hypothetical protein
MKREQQAAVKNHTLPPRHYLTMRRVLGTRLVIEWSSPVLPPLLFILVRIYQNFSVSLQTRLCHGVKQVEPHTVLVPYSRAMGILLMCQYMSIILYMTFCRSNIVVVYWIFLSKLCFYSKFIGKEMHCKFASSATPVFHS